MPFNFSHHKIAFTIVLSLLSIQVLLSQAPKGLRPAEHKTFSPGKTRALVVGISGYQHIDKLEYADRDAEVFAEYLETSGFWNIAKGDITVLTNEKAKRGDLTTELYRIALLSHPGDNLVFYFSGHGDSEILTEKGYLLPQDTYSNNYMAGAISVNELKDLFVALATKNVQVIVITDACRAGKLAGGRKGVKYTGLALSEMWHNEIKILSSQPEEVSQEGKQWGNGRGIFSYYLINGLNGAADINKDSLVTLSELQYYFGQTVVLETKDAQQPVVRGPKEYSTVIARIKTGSNNIKSKPAGNSIKKFARIMLPEDSCNYYHRQMNIAISEKRFENKDPNSASANYRKLRSCTSDTGFLLGANSQLLSALMNTAQEIVNNSFIGKNFVREKEYDYAIDLFDQVLLHNDLRLPYQQQLTNLKRYLKVLGTTIWGNFSSLPSLELILDSALKQEPEAAYLLSAKGILELRNMNYTKAIELLEKATEKSPGWLIPKYYLGIGYGYKKNYRKALDSYNEILTRDSMYRTFDCAKCILETMAGYEKRLKRRNFDKYAGDLQPGIPDSARMQLADNIDSAYFYHSLGRKYDKKNHPYEDSVYFLYTQAVLMDPEEIEYMNTLLRYLRKKTYGIAEVREWLRRWDGYADDDKGWLMEELLYSYIYAKEFDKGFPVLVELYENGYFGCTRMKKMSNKFGKLPEYQAFIKENCSE